MCLPSGKLFCLLIFSCLVFLVHGLKHAFPGRLLHHAGGEETAENTQFTLPERLCGPARPPYKYQKHMGATQPQREMKSWWRINDKWMHWITSWCRGEDVCVSVSVCASMLVCKCFGSTSISTVALTTFLRKVQRNHVREWVIWVRWMVTCVCLYIIHQWWVIVTGWRRIGQLDSYRMG